MMKEEKRFHKGTESIADTEWTVKTLKDDKFILLGTIIVPGSLVSTEMDAHLSIKGYEPYDIALKIAAQKWPHADRFIVSRVYR